MNDPITLTGSMNPVNIHEDGITLLAPDLKGRISEVNTPNTRDLRSITQDEGTFETLITEAAQEQELEVSYEFYLEVEEDGALQISETRKGTFLPLTANGEDAIMMNFLTISEKKPIAILHQDEAGILQWIFPQETVTSESQEVVFHIPRKSSEPERDEELPGLETRSLRRGLFGRIIRVITGVATKIFTPIVRGAVTLWEQNRRPYGISLIRGNVIEPNFSQWNLLKPTEENPSNKTLLFIHGTFVTVSGSFQPLLDSSVMPSISTNYGNQVLGFEHPTLHQSPSDNVNEFLMRLPSDREFNFDIVTGSRGGLVARELIRRVASNDTLGRNINIDKTILVACCNLGTPLADDEHIISFLNRYTLLASLLPLGTVGAIINAVFAVIKVLAGAALRGLPGLVDQRPFERNTFLPSINTQLEHPIRFFGVGANYNPQKFNIGRYLLNRTVDLIFDKAENDVVVPTKGCYHADNTFSFPIEHKIFDESFDIFHLNYFRSQEVQQMIQQWLVR